MDGRNARCIVALCMARKRGQSDCHILNVQPAIFHVSIIFRVSFLIYIYMLYIYVGCHDFFLKDFWVLFIVVARIESTCQKKEVI